MGNFWSALDTCGVRVQTQKGRRFAAASLMSFSRHREIYPFDGGAGFQANAPAHRLDEFPVGYSSAGWSPPEPASASPTVHQFALILSCRSTAFQRTAYSVLTDCPSTGGHRSSFSDNSTLSGPTRPCSILTTPAGGLPNVLDSSGHTSTSR